MNLGEEFSFSGYVLEPQHRAESSETLLLRAMLRDAVDCLSMPHVHKKYKFWLRRGFMPCEACDAIAWFEGRTVVEGHVHSDFEFVCESLGLAPSSFKRKAYEQAGVTKRQIEQMVVND